MSSISYSFNLASRARSFDLLPASNARSHWLSVQGKLKARQPKLTSDHQRDVKTPALSSDMLLLSCRATFKLALSTAAIMLLYRNGRIPGTAPQVLSKLAFNVTIPCMLLLKSAETLSASQGDPRYLLVPVIACAEVGIGLIFGHLAAAWAALPALAKPTEAQVEIAAAVANNMKAPALAPILYPVPTPPPPGMRSIVQVACGFGNSLTLPLLFLLSLFPASLSSVATGATALYLLGWSPMFWTLGHSTVSKAADDILAAGSSESSESTRSAPQPAPPNASIVTSKLPERMGELPSIEELRRMEASGKLLMPQVVDSPPTPRPAEPDMGLRTADMSDFSSSDEEQGPVRAQAGEPDVVPLEVINPNGAIIPPSDAQSALAATSKGSSNNAEQRRMVAICDPEQKVDITLPLLRRQKDPGIKGVIPRALEWRWVKSMRRILNPPLVATICGLVLGLSPLGPLLLTPGRHDVMVFAAQLPWELAVSLSGLRMLAETGALLGSLTLGLQLIVLGTSLLPQPAKASDSQFTGSNGSNADVGDNNRGWRAVWEVLAPQDRWERRQLIAVSVVRLVILPACSLGMIHLLRQAALLPPSRVCVAVLLVMSCMPSAQNLVLLMNLRPETASLAPGIARLLLRQIFVAIVPITVWISVFMSYLGSTACV